MLLNVQYCEYCTFRCIYMYNIVNIGAIDEMKKSSKWILNFSFFDGGVNTVSLEEHTCIYMDNIVIIVHVDACVCIVVDAVI